MSNNYVVIVAGGKGTRMGNNMPKQYLPLSGAPILMHTIRRFANSVSKPHIVLVIHPEMQALWHQLCAEQSFDIPHHLVYGGQTRFQSVKNGLDFIFRLEVDMDTTIIAIHDAARPFVTAKLIDKAFAETATLGATILAVSSTDSIRQGSQAENKALDREKVWRVQTPQTFKAHILHEAFKQAESPLFTDDASVVEQLGHPIHIIPGDHQNIKITFPEDVQIAELYLAMQGFKRFRE